MMIYDTFKMIVDLFSADFSNIGESIGQILGAGIGGFLGSFLGPVGTAIGAYVGRFLFGHIGESIQTAFEESDGFFDFFIVLFSDLGSKIWDGLGYLVEAFQWAWHKMENIPFIGPMFSLIRHVYNFFVTFIGWTWDYFLKPLGSFIGWLWDWVLSPLISGIGTVISAIYNFSITETFNNIKNSMMRGITGFLNGIIETVNSAFGDWISIDKFDMPERESVSESSAGSQRRGSPRVPDDIASRDRETANDTPLMMQGQQPDRTKEEELLKDIQGELKSLNRNTEEGNKKQAPTPQQPLPVMDDVVTAAVLSYQ